MPGFYVCVQIANVPRCSATCFVRRRDLEDAATQTVNPIQRCQKNTKDAVAEKEAAMQHPAFGQRVGAEQQRPAREEMSWRAG